MADMDAGNHALAALLRPEVVEKLLLSLDPQVLTYLCRLWGVADGDPRLHAKAAPKMVHAIMTHMVSGARGGDVSLNGATKRLTQLHFILC